VGRCDLFCCLYGELENDVLAGESLVDRRERVQLVFQGGRVFRVQEALDQPTAINAVLRPLADDLSGVDKILENLLVHAGDCPAVWPEALVPGGITGGFGHGTALSDENDVAVSELLLQLSGESLLQLPERFQVRHGHEDDNSLPPAFDVDLLGSTELESAKLHLELRDVVLQVEERLGHRHFYFIRRSLRRVGRPKDFGC